MRDRESGLAQHILPAAGTMLGICTTLIGLVKVLEGRIGSSHVDEYGGLLAIIFLASALASYASLRVGGAVASRTCERLADLFFVAGLIGLALVSLFFAYEFI